MQHSGLVLTFSPEPDELVHAVHEIQKAGVFTLGDLHGRRLVLALEASSPADAESWYCWLARLPGVRKVDIAFVSVEPQESEDVLPLNRKELAHAS
jgi:hypothetical protein